MNEAEANQNMEKKCPQCGAPLPPGALEGLCPACLLKQGAAETATGPEAAPFQPPPVEEIAKLFPQLEILGFVGKGGMGAVYKARQPALERIVALKILPPQAASGPGFAERFHREARALARLNHPNIVAVHDFGQAGALPFFIMEFVDGPNLRQLERAGKLSPREALQIVPQICEALQFAHDEGIVHRDIKPENILLDKKGRVKIADFGIAKLMGKEPALTEAPSHPTGEGGGAVTEQGSILGTPQYMAPEQLERPQSVDHRADIFSLGVVFYEMLTGELPLGKFAPPSRKVEVDVRLDDVVLRALEKEPERRYQQASQVKTAVEILGTAAPPPPLAGSPAPARPDAEALAREILARDYTLDMKSCVRRGWALVKSEFWPLVGITALFIALLSVASSGSAVVWSSRTSLPQGSSVLFLVLQGPLMGGLYLYFLRKIRREAANIELAFSGFSSRFLHLFLGSFVVSALTALGFVCLILPGIYLLVAWIFTLPLILDKGLDFWPAMELSRKLVTKHWWRFLGLLLVLGLLCFAGIIACVVGFFVVAPVALASLMYAYEDIFGGSAPAPIPASVAAVGPAQAPAASPAPPRTGPSGTTVLPTSPANAPSSGLAGRRLAVAGVTALVLVMGMIALLRFVHLRKMHRLNAWQAQQTRAQLADSAAPADSVPPAPPAEAIPPIAFGPLVERTLELNDPTRRALNLASGNYFAPAPGQELDAFGPDASNALRAAGIDLYLSDPALGLDNLTALDMRMLTSFSPDESDTNQFTVESMTAEQFREIVTKTWTDPDSSNDPDYAGIVAMVKARGLRNHEDTIRGTNVYAFMVRDGTEGVLQVAAFTDDPRTVNIRYKLLQEPPPAPEAARPSRKNRRVSRQSLSERLEAANGISNTEDKDRAMAAVARDAAKSGEVEMLQQALGGFTNLSDRDETSRQAALTLAKSGQRKRAIEIANGISNLSVRDQTLSELAKP
jgi:serine/threonine protein kinase